MRIDTNYYYYVKINSLICISMKIMDLNRFKICAKVLFRLLNWLILDFRMD